MYGLTVEPLFKGVVQNFASFLFISGDRFKFHPNYPTSTMHFQSVSEFLSSGRILLSSTFVLLSSTRTTTNSNKLKKTITLLLRGLKMQCHVRVVLFFLALFYQHRHLSCGVAKIVFNWQASRYH